MRGTRGAWRGAWQGDQPTTHEFDIQTDQIFTSTASNRYVQEMGAKSRGRLPDPLEGTRSAPGLAGPPPGYRWIRPPQTCTKLGTKHHKAIRTNVLKITLRKLNVLASHRCPSAVRPHAPPCPSGYRHAPELLQRVSRTRTILPPSVPTGLPSPHHCPLYRIAISAYLHSGQNHFPRGMASSGGWRHCWW